MASPRNGGGKFVEDACGAVVVEGVECLRARQGRPRPRFAAGLRSAESWRTVGRLGRRVGQAGMCYSAMGVNRASASSIWSADRISAAVPKSSPTVRVGRRPLRPKLTPQRAESFRPPHKRRRIEGKAPTAGAALVQNFRCGRLAASPVDNSGPLPAEFLDLFLFDRRHASPDG